MSRFIQLILKVNLVANVSSDSYHHISVLFKESLDVLPLREGATIVDCTLGGGGHTKAILEKIGPIGRLVAFDRDLTAIERARLLFKDQISQGQLTLIHANFGSIATEIERLDLNGKLDAIFADIGVSSHHLDAGERGFSFASDGPLDMRMDQSSGFSASDFLQSATEEEISRILWIYGEEPKSRFIAKLICERREANPFLRTSQLATLIASKVFYKEASRKHPATRTFQALRIHVNDELGELRQLLAAGPGLLAPKGVFAIITFHSLEDRIVKDGFQTLAGKGKNAQIPRDLPLTAEQVSSLSGARANIIQPFPIIPSDQEIEENPRARSAKLRAIRFF